MADPTSVFSNAFYNQYMPPTQQLGAVATSTTVPTTSNQLPPLPPLTAPQPLTLTNTPLDMAAINGGQYVAANLPGSNAGPSVTQIAQQLQNQLGYTPTNTGSQMVQNVNSNFALPTYQDATKLSLDSYGQILNSDNAYIQNARLRGQDLANSRGMLNGSIAAGSSQRAAVEASQPIFQQATDWMRQRESNEFNANQQSRQQALGLDQQRDQNQFTAAQQAISQAQNLLGQREQLAAQANESQLGRTQSVNNALLQSQLSDNAARLGYNLDSMSRNEQAQLQNWINNNQTYAQASANERDAILRNQLQRDTTLQQDWLANQQWTREFNGTLAMLPIKSATDMYSTIAQYALQEPDVYTPDVISGFTNFFRNDMQAALQQLFGGTR